MALAKLLKKQKKERREEARGRKEEKKERKKLIFSKGTGSTSTLCLIMVTNIETEVIHAGHCQRHT